MGDIISIGPALSSSRDWDRQRRQMVSQILSGQGGNDPYGAAANAGNKLMNAWMVKKEDDKQKAKEQADREAFAAMVSGSQAKPWVNPDTGRTQGTAGGMEGMISALGNHMDSDYARQTLADLLAQRESRNYSQEEYMRKRQDALADFEAQQKIKQKYAGPGDMPMSLKEWGAYQSMSEDEKRAYLNMKRSPSTYINLGNKMAQPDPVRPGEMLDEREKGLPPEQTPEHKAEVVAAQEQAKEDIANMDSLPQVIADADESIRLVDELVAHPGMSDVVGMKGWGGLTTALPFVDSAVPGTDAAGFMARLEQLGGKQFLQAFQSLKGGGHITEIEGEKATNAISRLMQTGQSEEEYLKAAQEYKQVINAGLARAKAKVKAPMAPKISSESDVHIDDVLNKYAPR